MNHLMEEQAYYNLLKKIAHTQRKLFSYSMDWKNRKRIQIPKYVRKGFWGIKKVISEEQLRKEELLRELEQLKQQARENRRRCGVYSAYYWWDVPWEEVEEYLLFNLAEEMEVDGWRFEYQWEVRQKDDLYLLLLHEEGHCQEFDKNYELEFYQTSQYSSSEQDQMTKQFVSEMNKKDAEFALFYNDYRVHSLLTEKTYDSPTDYLYSAEHYLFREGMQSKFQESLYQEHQLNATKAVSKSVHYKSMYAVAAYQTTKEKSVEGYSLYDYELVEVNGNLPKECIEERQKKDAAIAWLAYLADQEDIKSIPYELLGDGVTKCLNDRGPAIQYAEIMTCIGHKISFE